ncbi:MAG: hypothetical protein GY953_09155, partial [bacterium]|nr:hypothetical protein [bacterium]
DQEIEELRRQAAVDLHGVCNRFVGDLNSLSLNIEVELSPERYGPESFRDTGPNIIQINASGRIVQLAFEPAEPTISTEHYRVPYTLEGAVRWFNQESLEGLGIKEHLLFFCLEKRRRYWVRYDAQTHRKGPVDEEYLADLFEDLL